MFVAVYELVPRKILTSAGCGVMDHVDVYSWGNFILTPMSDCAVMFTAVLAIVDETMV